MSQRFPTQPWQWPTGLCHTGSTRSRRTSPQGRPNARPPNGSGPRGNSPQPGAEWTPPRCRLLLLEDAAKQGHALGARRFARSEPLLRAHRGKRAHSPCCGPELTLPSPRPQRGLLSYQARSHHLVHQGTGDRSPLRRVPPVTDSGSWACEKRPRPAVGPLPPGRPQGPEAAARPLLELGRAPLGASPARARPSRAPAGATAAWGARIPAPLCLRPGLCWASLTAQGDSCGSAEPLGTPARPPS